MRSRGAREGLGRWRGGGADPTLTIGRPRASGHGVAVAAVRRATWRGGRWTRRWHPPLETPQGGSVWGGRGGRVMQRSLVPTAAGWRERLLMCDPSRRTTSVQHRGARIATADGPHLPPDANTQGLSAHEQTRQPLPAADAHYQHAILRARRRCGCRGTIDRGQWHSLRHQRHRCGRDSRPPTLRNHFLYKEDGAADLDTFEKDVIAGFAAPDRFLPSKYIYDDAGSGTCRCRVCLEWRSAWGLEPWRQNGGGG